MNFAAFVRRSLAYQWRGNLAVFLGIALGSAVLTGALLVGDSLRGSLLDLSLNQLGWVDEVLAPGRLFSEALAKQLPGDHRAALVLLNGSASPDRSDDNRSVGMQLFAVNPDFWSLNSPKDAAFWSSNEAEVAINEPLANDLGVKVGDMISLNVQKSDNIPRETLLGKRKNDDITESLSVKVREILPNNGMARFSIRPTPEPARNAFVTLGYLRNRLNLTDKVNAVLLHGFEKQPKKTRDNFSLGNYLTLSDWGLKLLTPDDRARKLTQFLNERNDAEELRRLKWTGRVPEELAQRATADGVLYLKEIQAFYRAKRPYLLLQSDHLYLDATTEAALEKAFDLKENKYHPTLIYLADRLASEGTEDLYATVAAVLPDQVPGQKNTPLADGDIRLVDWSDSPLKSKVGAAIELEYYFPDAQNKLVLKKATFNNRGSVPLVDAADDPDWTPEYPGLTDKLTIGNWENPPFPPYSTAKLMDRIKPIKPAIEEFWKRYRATPKAYITLAAGQKLFATRFGKLTALRIDVPSDVDPNAAAEQFDAQLRLFLDPERGGFVIQDLRGQALKASSGSTDFGVLFLSFSFFLILSALLLVGLLVRLNLERRAPEIGLLAATGWGPDLIGRLLRREGWVLIVLGSAVGLVAARAFAAAMLRLLAVNWPGQGTLQFLTLHETIESYAIGFAASAAVSALTLRWAFRMLKKRTPRQLLSADLANVTSIPGSKRKTSWSTWVLAISLLGAAGSIAATFFATNHEALAGSFFGGGFFVLSALLACAWRWLHRAATSDPQPTLASLGIRNAGRNPMRSLLTIGLLAAATFLIVAVKAFHREPATDFFTDRGGSGGFRLFALTDVPLYQSLADRTVQADLGLKDDVAAKIQDVQSLRLQPGDDASCLNLYKPLTPRLLGVPESLIHEARFAFAASLADSEEKKKNPWLLLNEPQSDGSVPAIIDSNTAQWILKVSLGGILPVKNQAGDEVKLRIVGLLKESMFQSEVLVSESPFLKLFPSQQGYQFFLIRCAADDQDTVLRSLKSTLATQGGQVRPTFDRLAAYLAVENTYLATFQALGGLGLLLGAIGLAIVLVRGIWERRAELALLRALGFQSRQLATMVLAENIALLLMGLGVGCAAALVAIAPHLLGGDAKLLWGQIGLLLAGVTAIGLAAGTLAVAGALRTPVLTALRRE